MEKIQKGIKEYISMRQALGFELEHVEKRLFDFFSFMQDQRVSYITKEIAVKWAKKPKNARPSWWAKRLGLVRGFAKYWSAMDTRTEIIPVDLLPAKYERRIPYIYTKEEIDKLLGATKNLSSKLGLRPLTYYTLLGLISVTGLRISEAVSIKSENVDLRECVLTICESKFKKSRIVPIHISTRNKLKKYAIKRDYSIKGFSAPSFFVSDIGSTLTVHTVRRTFKIISHQIGLRAPSESFGPCLHDMRHRFAVNTLINWYRSGVDVERNISKLSTYLGHAHVEDTYWYLSAVPELLALAGNRLEKRWEAIS